MKIVYRSTAQAASSQACTLEPLKTAKYSLLGKGDMESKEMEKVE